MERRLYKTLLADGRVERIESKKQPKGLSPKTVRNIHQIISSALKLAIEQRLIARNPAVACALPKVEHREMKTLPPEQLASFLREAKTPACMRCTIWNWLPVCGVVNCWG